MNKEYAYKWYNPLWDKEPGIYHDLRIISLFSL